MLWTRFFEHFVSEIREDIFLEMELLLLTFATGIEDTATFLGYRCFTSNQTGNTVLLAMSLAGSTTAPPVPSLMGVSLLMFILGAWINGQIGNQLGRCRRLWLVVSSSIQTALVLAGSGLGFGWVDQETNALALGLIAFLGFSSGSQVAMVRSLLIPEISTANATSTYVDIVIDEGLYTQHNRKRNRRLLFILILCVGSFSGAYIYRAFEGPTTLLFSAMGKLMVTILFVFNRKKEGEKKTNYSTDSFMV